jgi:predicted outer membrane repeat protein
VGGLFFLVAALFCGIALGGLLLKKVQAASGVVTNCTETGLRNQINNAPAGGTITFNCGVNPFTITLTAPLTITADTVIDGGTLGKVTISGGNVTRIFTLTNTVNFTLQNLVLTQGNTASEGSVINRDYNGVITQTNAVLNIVNSSIFSNSGTAIQDLTSGFTFITNTVFSQNGIGILKVYGRDLTIQGSTFSNNSDIGVWSIYQPLSVISSTFSGNTNAGISITGNGANTNYYLTDTNITNNGRGMLIVAEGNIFVKGSNFNGNTVNGGLNSDYFKVFVENSNFSNNATSFGGGAIFTNLGDLVVTNTVFLNNSAPYGGAIYVQGYGAKLKLVNDYFEGNVASDKGGAIFSQGQAQLNSDNTWLGTTFFNNRAGDGGAFFSGYNGKLLIENTTFISNSATTGNAGAVTSYRGNITIRQSTFNQNKALNGWGGAVNLAGNDTFGSPLVENSTFFENAAKYGGAIGSDGFDMYMTVTNSTLYSNSALIAGAAIGLTPTNQISVVNSIIANSPTGGNCSGTIFNLGNNIDSAATCGFGSTNNSLSNTDPKLDSLKANGGATKTLALLTGSPAIEKGNNAKCPSIDQRGYTRVSVVGGANVGANCDVGAFEYVVATVAAIPTNPSGFDGSQNHQSPVQNWYPGLDFQPCFQFWDWARTGETAPLKSSGSGQPGFGVSGNRAAGVTSENPNFSCEINRVANGGGLAPDIIGTSDFSEAEIWAFSIGTPAPVTVEGLDTGGNTVASQNVNPNFDQGQITQVTLQGNISKIKITPNFNGVTGNTRCDLNTNVLFRYCIVVDNFSITKATQTSGGVVLLGATTRLAATTNVAGGTNSFLTASGLTPKANDASAVLLTARGVGGIPAEATGIMGVLTNVGCSGGGNFRFWTGATVPNAANLNVPGAFSSLNLSTNFIAPLDSNGQVWLGLGSGTNVKCGYVVDITAYLTAASNLKLLPATYRLAATTNVAGGTVPLLQAVSSAPTAGNSGTILVTARGQGNIPNEAIGIVGVLTNVGCSGGGNFRFWTGTTVPNAANLNVPGALPSLNLSTGFTAPLDGNGQVYLGLGSGASVKCGYVLDIVGYLVNGNGSGITLLNQTARIAATTNVQGGTNPLLTATGLNPIANDAGTKALSANGVVPPEAKGLIGVLTNVGCNKGGNFRFWIGNISPNAANMNVPGALPSLNLSTGFVAPLDSSSKVNLGLGSGASATSCGYAVDVVAYVK